jgi:hypothetical protein
VLAPRFLVPIAAAAAAVGLLVAPGASAQNTPREVTMRPTTLPMSFKLPFYWERQKAPRGYGFYSRSDDLTAALAVLELPGKVTSGSDLANAGADLIEGLYGRVDPNTAVQVSRVVLPAGVGIKAIVRYSQVVNGSRGNGVAVLYFLSHGSHGYAFMFHTGSRSLPAWEKVFTHTARTIRWSGSSL